MIKSSTLSCQFANPGKQESLDHFIDEYQRVVSSFIDLLWYLEKVPQLLPFEITSQIKDSWLSARAIQAAGKQASGIVRGTRKKQEQRAWKIQDLHDKGYHRQARKLEAIHQKRQVSKPLITTIQPELDSRFVSMDFENSTTFDGWINISSLGEKIKIQIPVKFHKHFNRLNREGILKKGIRISKKMITLMFEIEKPEKKLEGSILGIDIGYLNVLSCSNGFQSQKNKDEHDLQTISRRLSRKIKGSKAFARAQTHRKNFIHQTINQLNLDGIQEVRLENIKNLRKGRRSSRLLSHWIYPEIVEALESRCLDQGVLVKKVSPTYTSQRCSGCGWTRKSNRKGKQFRCGSCGLTLDSDLNASKNIVFDLRPIGKSERLQNKNRKGFYWTSVGQEQHIVPDVQKVHSLNEIL